MAAASASRLSVVFNSDDELHFVGNDDEGMSCPTCGNPSDPETYTIRVFVGGEDGISYDQFTSFIPLIDDLTKYTLLADSSYVRKKQSPFRSVHRTDGLISIRQFDEFVGISITFEDDGHVYQIYSKSVEHIKIQAEEIVSLIAGEAGNEWKHMIETEDLLKAIEEVSTSSTYAG